ncbi:hypothetical protein [Pontibacter actiniarum]|uniref:STAS/SEC14 domain-containing protein n=1 Tax=Pontibacter actiniarum TaxID=323450 RepID=A0A1X9YQX2_9BACT|nr:hypothetical protein [Pontibacter actiniarum]ARS35244.1 hypothetical protein CA264_07205 [Pontibacter actiniarum]
MVIFENPYAIISYQEQAEFLQISWLRKPSAKLLAEIYLHALEFVATHTKLKLFCTDQTQIGPLEREQENWLIQEYYPKVYQIIQDDIHAAIVFSERHFNAIVMNYQVPVSLPHQRFIQFNYFTQLQEALHWLEDVKKGQEMVVLPPKP